MKMPDKLPDTEIIKALECCAEKVDYEGYESTCCGCLLITDNSCTCTLAKLALDLINRLQAENIEKEDTIQFADKIYKEQVAENKRLVNVVNRLTNRICDLKEKDETRHKVFETKCEELEIAKAENERLKLELADTKRDLQIVLDNSISAKLPHCVLCGNDVAVLTKDLKGYDAFIADISTEAYKECIKKVKEEIEQALKSNYKARAEREKKEINLYLDDLFWNYCSGKIDCLRGLDYFLDNLLKELVGE